MKGISQQKRREVGVNLTGGRVNSVEIGQKIMGIPTMDELLDQFKREKGLGDTTTDPRYVTTCDLVKTPIVETHEGIDDTNIDDVKPFREAEGGYEVSSKGDKRFSALFAKLSDGYTIEEHYQLRIKGWGTLGVDHWKLGKGKPPKGTWEGNDLYRAYLTLWKQWASENPALIEELRHHAEQEDNTLSDCFAHGRAINQARALAEILNYTPVTED